MNKILCIGDSFTYGDELPNPSTQAWPALLANMNNWEVKNMGIRGGSNERLVRVLFEEIDNNYDLVILSWTVWLRLEVYNTLRNTPVCIGVGTYGYYKADWAKDYYASWHNDLFSYKRMLTQIILTQNYLKSINQKYICSMVYKTYPTHDISEFDTLLNKVDTSLFLNYPETLDSMVNDLPKGYYGHPLEEGHIRIASLTNEFIHSKYPSLK